jgi:hypothetical protein
MTKINFVEGAVAGQPRWETIGKGWMSKDGKSINVLIGNARRVTNSEGKAEYQEQLSEVLLTPGSKLFVTPSGLEKKDGSTVNPPSHYIKLIPSQE